MWVKDRRYCKCLKCRWLQVGVLVLSVSGRGGLKVVEFGSYKKEGLFVIFSIK